MKIVNAGFLTLLVFQIVCGQTASSVPKASPRPSTSASSRSYPNAKTQANELSEAVISGDYEKAADLTNPKLIELIGGRASYVQRLKRGMNEMESEGFQIMSVVAGDPTQVIELGSDVYAVLPTTLKVKAAEGVLVSQSSTIGVSKDRGEHWTFVDSGRITHEQLKTLFPAVADRLKVPQQTRAVLQRAP